MGCTYICTYMGAYMAIYQNQAKNKNKPPKNMKETGPLVLLSDFRCQIAQIHIFEGPSRPGRYTRRKADTLVCISGPISVTLVTGMGVVRVIYGPSVGQVH